MASDTVDSGIRDIPEKPPHIVLCTLILLLFNDDKLDTRMIIYKNSKSHKWTKTKLILISVESGHLGTLVVFMKHRVLVIALF